MKKKNKYQYLRVLQEWNGEAWADSCFYDLNDREQMRESRRDIRDYRENGVRCRFISRRVPNDGRIIGA